MRVRAKVVAKGKVQSAGYRDEVEEVALDLGIKGFVRNMEEKDRVEIVCESDERIIDKFLKKIKIKNEIIDVKKLDVKKIKPTGEFKTFRIIRGDKDSEIAERMDEAVKHLKGVKKGLYEVRDEVKGSRDDIKGVRDEVKGSRDDIKGVRDEVKGSRDDIKGVRDEVKGSRGDVREMHQDMNKRFDWVAEKYGDIGAGITSIKDDLKELKNMGKDVKEMKNLFAKLVNHIVKE